MPLLDAKGNLIPPTRTVQFKKAAPPLLGEKLAPRWASMGDREFFTLPGGATVMFDLSKLTLADFRVMRDHYQVNASLCVLTFMIHQMDWRIECENKKIEDFVTENVRHIWTQLVRSISQSFWAGYSPNVLQWENDVNGRFIRLHKIKDLIPEECSVNWKEVEGYAPPGMVKPKIRIFDGIKIFGQGWPIPVENSFWYPLLMENGDYFGRKLLRPVFTSWYFSILVHLFSNRYFERFGEPVPIGRAPYEDEINVKGERVLGSDLMVNILQNLRNRSVVVLPNDRTQVGTGTGGSSVAYDYDIEYLESQMRGADFERYLTRLDEEISLGLFTPLLILRTADVGSYNLGNTHWNVFMNMLNAISGDMKSYIDPYILSPLVDYNFGVNAPRARIIFRKLGDDKMDLARTLIQALVSKDRVKPDINELGDIAGLTFSEVRALTDDGQSQEDNNSQGDQEQRPEGRATARGSSKKGDNSTSSGGKAKSDNSRRVISNIAGRISAQVNRFLKNGAENSSFEPSFGYERQLEEALTQDGIANASEVAERLRSFSTMWLKDLPVSYMRGEGAWGMLNLIEATLVAKLEELINA